MHCLSRTPSTRKSQLNSNYSGLTLKFGALPEGHRMTSLKRSSFMNPPPQDSSEIIQIKDARNIDEVGNFASRANGLSPFMIDRTCRPYESVIKFETSSDPISCSQQTTLTTLSRDNSLKCANLKKGRIISKEKTTVAQNSGRTTSFAEKLKKCTQKVLIFKTEVNNISPQVTEGEFKVKKNISSGSIGSGNSISNSSLKEIDEEEFTSSELAQMMFEANEEIRHLSAHTSWCATTSV